MEHVEYDVYEMVFIKTRIGIYHIMQTGSVRRIQGIVKHIHILFSAIVYP